MKFFTAQNICTVLNGQWLVESTGPGNLIGVGTDSRDDLTNRAFIALTGPTHDGHDHLRSACTAGAQVLIVQRSLSFNVPDGVAVLQVTDTRAALGDLAAAYRKTLANTTVIAVTGSCGKTTTKEMIHAALATTYCGTRAPKSFNNDIGVPLTILAASPDDEYLVLEIGMNQPGEIAQLAAIAEPDMAIITTIGPAHLGGLGSMQAIANEKASLLDALRPDGVAVLNTDHDFAHEHVLRVTNIIQFGASPCADVRLTDHGCDEAQQLWWFDVNQRTRFRLAIPGRHNAANALAAVAVARHLGVADEAISRGLAGLQSLGMRMARHDVGDVTIYNDAYNANPQSMQASIEAFLECCASANRRVLILGDMLELGAESAAFHESLGQALLDAGEEPGIDQVIFIGELMHYAERVVSHRWGARRVQSYGDLDGSAIGKIWHTIQPGDAVLLKASRGLELERIIHQRPELSERKRSAAVV